MHIMGERLSRRNSLNAPRSFFYCTTRCMQTTLQLIATVCLRPTAAPTKMGVFNKFISYSTVSVRYPLFPDIRI